MEPLCEFRENALAGRGIELEIHLFRLDLLGVECHIEVAVYLNKASYDILGGWGGPCNVYVFSDFPCLWGVRLGQFELSLIAEVHKHLQILNEMRQGLWGDQDGVLLLLRFDGVVGQEIGLHATTSPLSSGGRISDVNSGINTVEAPSVFRVYYHAVLIEVEVDLFLAGAAPYLIHKLQYLYKGGEGHYLAKNLL